MIGTDRPLNKQLKRILDHVQLLTDGWIKSGKMNPPTIDVEFAEPEIESGRLVWLSELALTNFAYCISLPTNGNISAAAKIFRDWIRAKNF
jgi:hypothetical protein